MTVTDDMDKRRRAAHPETISVGGQLYVRNDIIAQKFGVTEKTLNLHDRRGALSAFFGGIKYKAQPQFDEHVLEEIRRQQAKRKAARR